ncbi:MAG: hypothetical protein ACLTMR_05330 [Faecalibacillus sp.]|nr:MAG TPA: hypothetical protein [Caudoviricetes sp.]
MINKKTCTYENYCEDYNEIMYKIMILSGTVDKIYKDIFKPNCIGLYVLGETFSLSTDSVYNYYIQKACSLPMTVIIEMIISHYNSKDPLLEKVKYMRKLIEGSFKNFNAELTALDEKLAKDKFIEKWNTVDEWHCDICFRYNGLNCK